MPVEYLKPHGLHDNPAFTQALVIPPGARLVVIGGQNGVDANGQIVAPGDLGLQTARALGNLQLCLAAAGAKIEDLVKITIFIAGDLDIIPGFQAWMNFAGQPQNPPAVSVIKVLALGRPGIVVEIEGLAVLPG
ncbi:MAG: RidA family protein [Hyphomicrobiales bacterium]|nr:MAG: RidA family protein [Hyphomicrobiales bacterium]